MCAARTVLMVIMMLRHTVLLRCAVLHLCNQTIYLVNIVRLVRCATKLRHTLKQFFQIGGVLRAVDKPVNRVRIIRVAVGAGDFIQKCAVKDNIVAEAHCINRRAVEMIAHRYATFAIMTADDQIIIDAADIYLRHIMPSQMNLIVAAGVVVHIVNRVMPGMPVEAVHIVAAAAEEMIITIIAAAEPARRAGSLPPIDALRPADDRSDHSLRLRTVFGVLAAVLGVGFGIAGAHFPTIGGFDMDLYQRLSAVAVGALFLLAGLWLSGPALASISPGLPIGPIGRLASRNSSRNPRRTATTAFALALGVGLVACVGVIGATAQASVFGLVESKVKAPFVLDSPNGGHSSGLAGSPTGGGGLSIPEEAITTVENLDGVNSVGVLMSAPLQADHWDNPTTTVVSGDISPFVDIGVVRGTSEFGDQPGAMISTTYAKQSGLGPGDTFTLRPYLGGEGTDSSVVTIRGVYEETGLLGHMVINLAGALRVLPDLEAYNRKTAFVTSDGRFSDSMLRRELEDAVAQYLVVQVKAKEEYKGALGTQVNQMVSLIYGLLALAVVIAVMGIINTLALSVSERTRELGTLRAIGVSRSQIRRMIQLEAVQMSVFGALCGVVVGVFAGWCVVTVLQDKGMSSPHVPWSQVALMMAGSVVVGLLAALVPAQKAAATPPLEAIAE